MTGVAEGHGGHSRSVNPPGTMMPRGFTDAVDDERRQGLLDERDHLLASLRDLDAERAAGDIDPDDYARLRDVYTARAAAVLRALDGGGVPRSDSALSADGAGAMARRDEDGGATPSAVARPRKRSMLRTVAVVVVVGMAASGAGLAMARGAGERLPGQEATGDIERSTGDRIAQAQALAADGRLLDAIKVYDELLRNDPDHPVALAQRGWLVSRAGLADEGLETIDRAIEIEPGYPDAWFFKAMIHWRLKDEPAEARAAFEQLLALDPPEELARFVRDEALPQLPPG